VGEVADLVKEYYWLLRGVLRAHPDLRPCLTRCRHCGIFFLTHPRNAGRRDLRCPFGCRQTHRKRESTKRSVAYYRGEEGRKCRREQNGNRQWTGMAPVPAESVELAPQPPVRVVEEPSSPDVWPTPMLMYLRMVVSLIEGRPVDLEEIEVMRARVLRQHSMSKRPKIVQTLARLHEHPP
jgi:hypothetical protein